jgi:hypothetical protein
MHRHDVVFITGPSAGKGRTKVREFARRVAAEPRVPYLAIALGVGVALTAIAWKQLARPTTAKKIQRRLRQIENELGPWLKAA